MTQATGSLPPISIPVYQPSLGEREKTYLNEAFDSTWISSKGSFLERFEKGFSAYVGGCYATAVCNGTVALHLALTALGIGPNDEVIVPTLTYIASVNAIRYTGATPVFVDSIPDTWQMNQEEIRKKLTVRTRAILVVHLYGHPCDMPAITSIASEKGLFVIEDCAEAIGSRIASTHVGRFGDIATFSFFGNKTITTGEGGMVITKSETLFDRIVHLKGQGLAKYREYWHDTIGFNYRMTNLCAAIGLAQLERIDSIILRKRQIAEIYKTSLNSIPVEILGEKDGYTNSYWMCSLATEDVVSRDEIRNLLRAKGIETRPVFHPVHTMPMYDKPFAHFPVAESLGRRGLNLPSWPDLPNESVEMIAGLILNAYHSRR